MTVASSMIGYEPVERTLTLAPGDVGEVNFRLEERPIALEEVVASVEAAQVQRKEMGTDITQLDVVELIETAAVTSFTDLLNARAENVQITQGPGQRGTGARITARGATSLIQENVPLIIVDGIRYSNQTQINPTNRAPDAGGEIDTGGQITSRFEGLNPYDIQTSEVVKASTAATPYGSEAASGVLVITTQKGERNQEPRFTLRTREGIQVDNGESPFNYADGTTRVRRHRPGGSAPDLRRFREDTGWKRSWRYDSTR